MTRDISIHPVEAAACMPKHRFRPEGQIDSIQSKNIPDLLSSMTEFTAGHTRTQTVVRDTNSIVLERVRKIIMALGHRPNKDTNTLALTEGLEVILGSNDRGLVGHGDFATVGREVVGDGVLDDAEEFLLGVCGADGEAVEELDHEAGETLECAWDAHGGVHFDEDAFGCVDVDL